jgi:hypothetical protein
MAGAPKAAAGLAATILAAEDLDHHDETIPEWDGVTVRVRSLTGTERDAYEAKLTAVKRSGNTVDMEMRLADYRAKFLVKCLVDPATDKRIFTDDQAQQLGRKSSAVIERLFKIAKRVSGLSEGAEEEALGNSGTAPSGGSTTD